MKNLLILATVLLTFQVANAQSAKSAASNHVFVMCDSYGSPTTLYGQAYYISFYSTGKVIMLCGRDLSSAIKNGATKTGTWSSSDKSLWFTWSDGKRSEAFTLDINSGNFSSGSVLLKDLGGF